MCVCVCVCVCMCVCRWTIVLLPRSGGQFANFNWPPDYPWDPTKWVKQPAYGANLKQHLEVELCRYLLRVAELAGVDEHSPQHLQVAEEVKATCHRLLAKHRVAAPEAAAAGRAAAAAQAAAAAGRAAAAAQAAAAAGQATVAVEAA